MIRLESGEMRRGGQTTCSLLLVHRSQQTREQGLWSFHSAVILLNWEQRTFHKERFVNVKEQIIPMDFKREFYRDVAITLRWKSLYKGRILWTPIPVQTWPKNCVQPDKPAHCALATIVSLIVLTALKEWPTWKTLQKPPQILLAHWMGVPH